MKLEDAQRFIAKFLSAEEGNRELRGVLDRDTVSLFVSTNRGKAHLVCGNLGNTCLSTAIRGAHQDAADLAKVRQQIESAIDEAAITAAWPRDKKETVT